jgi:predicted transcriptional regulator
MLTVLTLINTVMLAIVLADRIKDYFAKATWDDKLIAAAKAIIEKGTSKE